MSTTAAEAVESKSVSVLVRWHIDGLKEWIRKHLPQWMTQRIDPDFNPNDGDFERGLRVGARLGGYNEAPKNDGPSNTVIIGCTIALIVAFVGGAWVLSTEFAAFRGSTEEWKKAVELRLQKLENQ